jgi:hypothetical protein
MSSIPAHSSVSECCWNDARHAERDSSSIPARSSIVPAAFRHAPKYCWSVLRHSLVALLRRSWRRFCAAVAARNININSLITNININIIITINNISTNIAGLSATPTCWALLTNREKVSRQCCNDAAVEVTPSVSLNKLAI